MAGGVTTANFPADERKRLRSLSILSSVDMAISAFSSVGIAMFSCLAVLPYSKSMLRGWKALQSL